MDTAFIRKYMGYAGLATIILASLYLLYTVGTDLYLYDVEYSDGTDDARWTIVKESWEPENTIGLLMWGFYLLVTGSHLFLYFKRLIDMKDFNMWALPTFNVKGKKILSGILSVVFIFFVVYFDTTMPEVYTPSISRAEYSEMPHYVGIDSFWCDYIYNIWELFTIFTSLHLLLYRVSIKSRSPL